MPSFPHRFRMDFELHCTSLRIDRSAWFSTKILTSTASSTVTRAPWPRTSPLNGCRPKFSWVNCRAKPMTTTSRPSCIRYVSNGCDIVRPPVLRLLIVSKKKIFFSFLLAQPRKGLSRRRSGILRLPRRQVGRKGETSHVLARRYRSIVCSCTPQVMN